MATVNAFTGNEKKEYSYLDLNPYLMGYYRISQTDRDGKKTYYNTIKVGSQESNEIKMVQIVQANDVLVQISGATPGPATLDMYNTNGVKVATQQIMLANETGTFRFAKPAGKGIYVINLVSKGVRMSGAKLLVQ
jgi:hypothetical protein